DRQGARPCPHDPRTDRHGRHPSARGWPRSASEPAMVRGGMRRFLALAGAAWLGGCATVGPDYRVPESAEVHAAQAQGAFRSESAAVTAQPLPDHWWKLYDDPVLDGLIAQALAANTDLRVAEANLERSIALL